MPKTPLDKITQQELNQEAIQGLDAQKTDLDKLWYNMNFPQGSKAGHGSRDIC